jgi:BirA family transcriptional regulator, biotin operon repressor / biotin---[acetyl-CoA-carboxylase] ligase
VDPREWHEEIPSTQDRAIALARAGAPAGTRIVAARQSHGRGRLDHVWLSPPGGLYLSVIVPRPTRHATLLPLAIGAELAGELERRWSVRPRLKWPNDLYIEDAPTAPRKLSGILVDAVDRAPSVWLAVAGIGVNVAVPRDGFPAGLAVPPIALEELVRPRPDLADVEDAAATSAVRAAAALDGAESAHGVVERCRRLLYGIGRPARVDGIPSGTIVDVADDGALVLEQDGVSVTVRAGDLTVEGR